MSRDIVHTCLGKIASWADPGPRNVVVLAREHLIAQGRNGFTVETAST
jgi:hypothetical protein